jgi:DNA-binding CsgD family transcriptional regulator/tetratricopeptide (TPR) repeat protein
MALLALAGRPLEPALLSAGARELVAAGLAVDDDGAIAIRHALLGETAVALLDAGRRRALHERLARTLDEPGEAARHFLGAGHRVEAHERALIAAEAAATPGERAAHLGIAAACADGEDADTLRLRAASALLESGRAEEALGLLETVEGADSLTRAEAHLLEYLAARDLERTERARKAFAAAAELSHGTGSEVEVRVQIESADVAGSLDRDHAEALRRAESAYVLARHRDVHLHRARLLLGTWRLWEGREGWERLLRASVRDSFARQDYVTARDAVDSLVYGLLITGQPEQGRSLAARMAATAARLNLLGMERFMRSRLCGFLWHLGDWERTVDEAREIVGGAGEPAERRLAEFYLAQSLIDLGRYDEARRIADAWRLEPGPNSPVWLLSELELWSGRPHEADAVATEGLRELPAEGAAIFVRLAQCWARYDCEAEIGAPWLVPHHRMAEAAPLEERGIHELSAGHASAAVHLFDEAAGLWRGRHARGELRCLWATGEAARVAGDEPGARRRLIAAETAAQETGAVAVLSRIRRSLRLAGVRRAAPRGRATSGLTPREREILELVGAGLSNAEIGRRLGIGRPTVARLVSTASTKLGAGSRLQAAVLAAGK